MTKMNATSKVTCDEAAVPGAFVDIILCILDRERVNSVILLTQTTYMSVHCLCFILDVICEKR
jgi:hypothetical protein